MGAPRDPGVSPRADILDPVTVTDAATFGQAVREARLAHGLSMGQLASAVGRTAAAVRSWERDEAVPDGDVLERLADVLELDAAELSGLADIVEAPQDEAADDDAGDPFADIPGAQTGAIPVPADVTAATETVADPGDQDAWTLHWFRESLFDPDRPYLGYFRAGLTAVAAIVLLWVLVWATGELLGALGDVLDGFGIGE